MKKQPIEERFWSKVEMIPFHECWEWVAGKNADGYGKIKYPGMIFMASAHRVSWILHNGQIPKKMHVLHKCDNRGCVRPTHLFLGTNADNVKDKVSKHRQKGVIGSNHPLVKLTEEQVIEIRKSKIGCVTTGRAYGIDPSTVWKIRKKMLWKHI